MLLVFVVVQLFAKLETLGVTAPDFVFSTLVVELSIEYNLRYRHNTTRNEYLTIFGIDQRFSAICSLFMPGSQSASLGDEFLDVSRFSLPGALSGTASLSPHLSVHFCRWTVY